MENRNHIWSIILLALGIAMMLIAPIVLTRPPLTDWMDFTLTGQIGDTIGSITAPIVNLIGAVSIYFSFREQIKRTREVNCKGYLPKRAFQ